MPRYTITIKQTETRSYVLDADFEEDAIQRAQAWNEEATGDTPDGCINYQYSFDSQTESSVEDIRKYKEGDLFVNLNSELDGADDDDIGVNPFVDGKGERTTPPGNVWVVTDASLWSDGPVYCITCFATGASINPHQDELDDAKSFKRIDTTRLVEAAQALEGVTLARKYDARMDEILAAPSGDDYNNLLQCLSGKYEDPDGLSR